MTVEHCAELMLPLARLQLAGGCLGCRVDSEGAQAFGNKADGAHCAEPGQQFPIAENQSAWPIHRNESQRFAGTLATARL